MISRLANKPKGPYALKRVGLGSYSLRLKQHMAPEEWTKFIEDKADRPEQLAQRMIPVFIRFFEDNKCLGVLHAITTPPRSLRNLEKTHPMDLAAQEIARHLKVDCARFFEPWDKNKRGVHATRAAVTPDPNVIETYQGKVVWVLDDVTTTSHTLRASVQALFELGIHAHGLAYVAL